MRGRTARALGTMCLTLLLAAAAPPDSPVADAAMRGDADQVRALLRAGADVNASQGDGMTALHWAAERDDGALAEILIYAGANPEATTRIGGFTPLMIAARLGHATVVSTLLAGGADAGARTSTGETPLHFAAGAGSVAAAEALLARGADPDVTEYTKAQTPLMFAAALNRAAVMETLVAAGADVGMETLIVDYPLIEARDRVANWKRNNRLAAVHEDENFVENIPVGLQGVDGEVPDEEDIVAPVIPERDEDRERLSYAQLVGRQGGNTALHYSTREGHFEATSLLLEAGADVNRLSSGNSTSPLLSAVANGHFDLAMWLLERGADPTLASEANATPLFLVLHRQWTIHSMFPQPVTAHQQETDYLTLMRALLDRGADPNIRLNRDLWYASFNIDTILVNLWGATPFWRAAYAVDVDAMKLLMAYGADPTIPTLRPPGDRFNRGEGNFPPDYPEIPVGGPGVYPIHAASGVGYPLGNAGNGHRPRPNGWLPSVKYLVEELGADVNQRDFLGFTALHNAAARGDVELIHYLLDQGADIKAVTRKGQTVADMANGPVQSVVVFPQVVTLLESLGSENSHKCAVC